MSKGKKRPLPSPGNVKAKRSLGQNFLIDPEIPVNIAEAAQISACDTVIEIGPGLGALTKHLVAKDCYKLVLIEKDTKLKKMLSEQYEKPNLTIIEADALHINYAELLSVQYPGKIVANLPYNVATLLILQWLPLFPHLKTLTVMIQKELALRFMAHCKQKDYGSLSVYASLFADCKILFEVPPEAFDPPPKVDSAVIQFHLKQAPEINLEAFSSLLKACFAQKRKTLWNNLKAIVPIESLEAYFKQLSWSKTIRAEELSLNQFLALFQWFSHLKTASS